MNNEKVITCGLIDYLEKEFKFEFVAREVPFSSLKRRADLVAVDRKFGSTYGYEIKSDKDSLNRLNSQLEDYKLTFNYVYVVTTKKYVDVVKNYGAWFGILLFDDEKGIHCLRKARKRALSNVINSRPLLKFSEDETNFNAQYINWLCARYEPIYKVFLKERGTNHTSENDIKVLSLRSDAVSLF